MTDLEELVRDSLSRGERMTLPGALVAEAARSGRRRARARRVVPAVGAALSVTAVAAVPVAVDHGSRRSAPAAAVSAEPRTQFTPRCEGLAVAGTSSPPATDAALTAGELGRGWRAERDGAWYIDARGTVMDRLTGQPAVAWLPQDARREIGWGLWRAPVRGATGRLPLLTTSVLETEPGRGAALLREQGSLDACDRRTVVLRAWASRTGGEYARRSTYPTLDATEWSLAVRKGDLVVRVSLKARSYIAVDSPLSWLGAVADAALAKAQGEQPSGVPPLPAGPRR
ncbi:hypothetical protein [Motilibacter aurantiacus]|uniref:hypothetical protein n=1 Tax=Motilibacter aurantiacus TaxID=2714955 RepID=UPI001409CC69|nr:hypothetical protein [Motilibacter aurantiacus]NHC45972.1 hypothetical protein [Motilibacter aurantiacus]